MKQFTTIVSAIFLVITSSLTAMQQDFQNIRSFKPSDYMPEEKRDEVSFRERIALKQMLTQVKRSDEFTRTFGLLSKWGNATIKKSRNTIYVYYPNGVIETIFLDINGNPIKEIYSGVLVTETEQRTVIKEARLPKSEFYAKRAVLLELKKKLDSEKSNKVKKPSEIKKSSEMKEPRRLHDDMFDDFGQISAPSMLVQKPCETLEGCSKEKTEQVLKTLAGILMIEENSPRVDNVKTVQTQESKEAAPKNGRRRLMDDWELVHSHDVPKVSSGEIQQIIEQIESWRDDNAPMWDLSELAQVVSEIKQHETNALLLAGAQICGSNAL